MPLLWRYLLRNYLKVFSLSVAGFISVLLITRFQNIARFAATGASKLYILKFVLFQIPFILPLAIPISCLIASFLLFQKMSHSHEFTALRSAGLGPAPLLFPLITCGSVMALLNFGIVSEVAPKCRAFSKGLAYQMTAVNPLCLLQKETLIKLKNSYVDMKVLKSGKYAEDVIFIMRSLSNQRLGITLAKKVSLDEGKLCGDQVTFISSIDPKKTECFDHLVIENQAQMHTEASQISQYLRTSDWNISYDYLGLRMLQAKSSVDKKPSEPFDPKALQELAKRVTLALAALTFTIVGISFGMEISRTPSLKKVLWAIGMMVLFLICFVAAKSVKHDPMKGSILYLAAHPIILYFSLRSLKKRMRGIE